MPTMKDKDQTTAKVQVMQRSFPSDENPDKRATAKLDKEVNDFIDTMALTSPGANPLELAKKDGKNRILQSKNVISSGNRYVVVITYLDILDSNVATL